LKRRAAFFDSENKSTSGFQTIATSRANTMTPIPSA
jgi:hypothetical protein